MNNLILCALVILALIGYKFRKNFILANSLTIISALLAILIFLTGITSFNPTPNSIPSLIPSSAPSPSTEANTSERATDEPKIKTIKNISNDVSMGEKYQLPSQITATLTNGTDQLVNVKWLDSEVNTNEVGKFFFYGKVDDYSDEVKLSLKVISKDVYMSDAIKHFRTSTRGLYQPFASYNENMLVQGISYNKGIKIHSMVAFDNDFLEYNLEGKYSSINGKIAIDDNGINSTNITVEFYGDGNLLETYTLEDGEEPQPLEIDVTNVKILRIILENSSSNSTRPVDLIESKLIS